MSKTNDGHARSKYTLEFKLEAVRLIAGGQAVTATATATATAKILVLSH